MFNPTAFNILVVDDIPDNLRLLSKILESHHYTVRKALNGKMALQGAQREPPNLILLDINMPDLNGYEVCQQLKASDVTADIPIIFISALNQTMDKVRAFEMGGQDYITKPFQELEVLARVKNQLLIQQQHQELTQKNRQLEQEMLIRQATEAEVRRLNVDLERQVKVRTLELQQALKFESTLKRISDRVRDSLDSHQILQNAVEELAIALEVNGCDAVLHTSDRQAATVRYQYVAAGISVNQEQLPYMANLPDMAHQSQSQRVCFAYCQTEPVTIHNDFATLSCPIFDDQVDQIGTLGDLHLFRNKTSSFSELEMHLVQQVANQCAIALRQARLYEAAQAQVNELQRLNHLKDDFLNTISHELRTPIASMKMVLKLLNTITNHGQNLLEAISLAPHQSKIPQYFQVLQEECDRELALVEDLLSLQHIEAGTYTNQATDINLPEFMAHLIEPFETRTQHQQQIFQVNLASDLTDLNLDPRILNRVITELLTNACKYTPTGETITISARLAPVVTATAPANCLQIVVTNTGVEIATEELPRIFDKFYRIPNSDPWKHGGTGLGLALVKKLVEQMGGEIIVSSQNQTISFVVNLPLSIEGVTTSLKDRLNQAHSP